MIRINKRALLVLAAACLVWGDAQVHAEGRNRVGTAAAPELLIPVGARDMALGGASIATTSGIESLHWNPAGLSRSENNVDLMVSTMDYIAGIQVNYAALGGTFPALGNLALSIKSLDIGEIPVTTETQPDGTGGNFQPTFLTLGVHFGRNLTDRIGLGTTLNYIVNRIDRAEGTAMSFSAGLQYFDLGGIDGLDLGVVVKHIGQRLRYEGSALLNRGQVNSLRRGPSFYGVQSSSADLPSTFELGLSYNYPVQDMGELNFSSVFEHQNYSYDQYKMGVEYMYNDFLALRGGFDYAADAVDDSYLFGQSFGLGLNLGSKGSSRARLDYAYSSVDRFDALNTFTLQVGF
ncbi:MAG: PorV/PorQ family protein [Candidatus Latescibacteria bacterium]|nr:PorV/PorQ family protein [Candidatus Latescibacterota bacterium]